MLILFVCFLSSSLQSAEEEEEARQMHGRLQGRRQSGSHALQATEEEEEGEEEQQEQEQEEEEEGELRPCTASKQGREDAPTAGSPTPWQPQCFAGCINCNTNTEQRLTTKKN